MRNIDLENEKNFENSKVLNSDVRKYQSKYYWAVDDAIQNHLKKTCKYIEGKKVLEIGCSSGYDAEIYTKYSSFFQGIDISDEAINKANSKNLKNAKFSCTDGHELPFPDKSFDCVIVNSLLHHLDLSTSFLEIKRVLRDEGLLIFKEPLGTNPIFDLYRFFTPSARTPDERPFTFSDLSLMKRHFAFHDIEWFGFTNIFSAFFKVILLRNFLTFLDNLLSKTPLKYLYWQFCGVAKKR